MTNPSNSRVPLKGILLLLGTLAWFDVLAEGFRPTSSSKIFRSSSGAAAVVVIADPGRQISFHRASVGLRAETTDDADDRAGPGPGLSTRRSALASSAAAVVAVAVAGTPVAPARAARPNGLVLTTAPTSGLRWADAKVGTGELPTPGSTTSIDYSMASTAGRFPSIYSTKNGDEPYRWKLGDGSTIRGIEMAILGDPAEGIPPMRPGGIRRVIVPNALGYNALIGRDDSNNNVVLGGGGSSSSNLSPAAKNQRCLAGSEGSLGPIPPKDAPDGAYQRWYQFYCNPRIPYQPDLVLDIKLYGKRGGGSASTTATAAIVSPSSSPE